MKPLTKNYKSGFHLFRENDRSRELYIVQTGSIKIYRMAAGKEIELAVLGKGAVIGEIALIDGKPRSASAKAIEESTVIVIDADTFHERIRGVPPWLMTIIKMTGHKIRQANRRLQSISSEHQDINIIITLFYFFSRFDQENSGLDLKTVQRQLVQLLGVTHQKIVRVLEFLEQNNFVQISENSVKLEDGHKYSEYCDYLRLLIRKALPRDEILTDRMSQVIKSVASSVKSIHQEEFPLSELSGDDFWSFVKNNGLGEVCGETLETFRILGLIQYFKKQNIDKRDNPFAGYVFKINNSNWRRHYLNSTYKEMTFLP